MLTLTYDTVLCSLAHHLSIQNPLFVNRSNFFVFLLSTYKLSTLIKSQTPCETHIVAINYFSKISDSDPSRSMILLPPASATDGSVPARRHLVRGLIPLGASGLIIGHAGAIIKEMSEMSGTKVQLAEGADPYGTKERIVNVFSPTCEAAVQVGVFCQCGVD